MPTNQFIARRVSVGLGVEATAGTEVAPTDWYSQLAFDFQRKTTIIQNDSAIGRVEKYNDSAVVEEWAEGKLDGKLRDITFGYLLYSIFGSKSTATNADASGNVKDHTFSVAQQSVGQTLTITRSDPVSCRRHGLATVDSLEISGATGDWAKTSASIKAKVGVTSSDTAALSNENEFTFKHTTLKLATNLAGLTGATALPIKSFKLTISRPATGFFPAGGIDPTAFTTGPIEVTGEFVLQYVDNSIENTWFANTAQALSLTLKNTDVTIGTAAKPGVVFTLPRVRLSTFSMSSGLDDVVEQTVGFAGELDVTSGYLIQAVLTNLKASY